MTKNIKVSVIIPNWNGRDLLEDCLKSLRKQIFRDYEIIVVDNNSTDGSLCFIKQNFPETITIKLNKNYGFAKAINEGVRASKSEYVVFLNNDTEVEPQWLRNLVKTADSHREMASVGSKILNFYKRKMIDGVGLLVNDVGQARSLGWNEEDHGQFEQKQPIFGATAGAALFRREIFIKVGMFDESYFMYSEEVDWAFRAQFLGFKSILCPDAIVYHKHKMSSKKKPQHLEYWQFRNMTQTLIKDMPSSLFLKRWRWIKIILVHFNTIAYQIKNGYFWPPLLTDLWLLFHLGSLLKARSKIQSTRIVEDSYIEGFLIEKKINFWRLLK